MSYRLRFYSCGYLAERERERVSERASVVKGGRREDWKPVVCKNCAQLCFGIIAYADDLWFCLATHNFFTT